MTSKCPVLAPDYKLIKHNHGTLASTGCTGEFCQSGRIIHTDEPRVGENRAMGVVEQEAEDFLRELHGEKFFANEDAFQDRVKRVRYEIQNSSVEGLLRDAQQRGMVGGVWAQTQQELEFGLRRAWRNSRKCIMRSHCEDLKLCDLRSVKTSKKMAVQLVRGVSKAFNGGNILPTVFVFPPRTPNNRGPMIWNDQILTFAGYEAEDGSIIGDPKNVQLTKDIVELGWEPPQARSRWDVLPVVVMAEGDLPVIIELPEDLRKLVEIRHPKYSAAFQELDLKWVAFPALSRLGFDIGGVQYTATPFIGWFMDAEIGVRNLADTFRYNALPDIVKALYLDDGVLEDVDSFEDLPEYQKLAFLTRAQIELNYAVHYSFLRDKVTMSDSLTASQKWARYDDEFQKKNGFRLPADPYWIAPPQGSIIPLWHRGGAPNYQPKPMICRHVQDPVKAWKREKYKWAPTVTVQPAPAPIPMASSITLEQNGSSVDHGPTPVKINVLSAADLEDLIEKSPLSSILSLISEDGMWSSESQSSPSTSVDNLLLSSDMRPNSLWSSWDPISSTKPELLQDQPLSVMPERTSKSHVEQTKNKSVAIYHCGDGRIAEKLAERLQTKVEAFTKNSQNISMVAGIQALNDLQASELTADRVLLMVVVTTSMGDIPSNGEDFAQMCEDLCHQGRPKSGGFTYAILGIGDSRHPGLFNAAAIKIHDNLKENGGLSLTTGSFAASQTVQPSPWAALDTWWGQLRPRIREFDPDWFDSIPLEADEEVNHAKAIAIYYSSDGKITERLAKRVYNKVEALTQNSRTVFLLSDARPLNELKASELTADKVLLLVVSTADGGDIPANGVAFANMCEELYKRGRLERTRGFRFAVFGNGDSRYATDFNSAAINLHTQLKKIGGISMEDGPFQANRALQSPPWSALNAWWNQIQPSILELDPSIIDESAIVENTSKMELSKKPRASDISVISVLCASLLVFYLLDRHKL